CHLTLQTCQQRSLFLHNPSLSSLIIDLTLSWNNLVGAELHDKFTIHKTRPLLHIRPLATYDSFDWVPPLRNELLNIIQTEIQPHCPDFNPQDSLEFNASPHWTIHLISDLHYGRHEALVVLLLHLTKNLRFVRLIPVGADRED